MKRRLCIIGSLLAILLGVSTGLAWASIPDSAGVIHACYQSPPPAHGANLQVIDTGAGGSCSGGMVPLTWNQTGPQGPAGPQGSPGISGYQVVASTVHNPAQVSGVNGNYWTLSVDCPSGDSVLGGSATFTYDSDGSPVGALTGSALDAAGTGWQATWGVLVGVNSQNKTMTIKVFCAVVSS